MVTKSNKITLKYDLWVIWKNRINFYTLIAHSQVGTIQPQDTRRPFLTPERQDGVRKTLKLISLCDLGGKKDFCKSSNYIPKRRQR